MRLTLSLFGLDILDFEVTTDSSEEKPELEQPRRTFGFEAGSRCEISERSDETPVSSVTGDVEPYDPEDRRRQ